ncbi:MAG: Lrp/AsnC family transcriptional regulator [Desulfohalobiaceae bacterium]|nr:Lrp/AsnC family transcriptional regulator [Desulfohalobiaceae bacterium]
MNDVLDDLDREILNRIQSGVPLDKRPFQTLGREFGLSESEMLARVKRMGDLGIVRRLGPIINYPAWGMSGVLVAARAKEDRLVTIREVIEEYPEITHAYLRNYAWNFWFTVIAENEEKRDLIIAQVTQEAGLEEVKTLPQKKSFKLGVKFEL